MVEIFNITKELMAMEGGGKGAFFMDVSEWTKRKKKYKFEFLRELTVLKYLQKVKEFFPLALSGDMKLRPR